MCGFSGIYSFKSINRDFLSSSIQSMNHSIKNRGPDDSGYWISRCNKIALGHQRLAILDLSKSGAQPMTSKSGNLVIAFNGEIYNYKEVKQNLINKNWKSSSDTEVLLQSIEEKGIQKTLEEIEGMFAFAYVDIGKEKLYLARDRIGEKPLYYGWIEDLFVFGSQLKIIKYVEKKLPDINPNALAKYFQYGYVAGEESIFKDIYRLTPGTFIELDLTKKQKTNVKKYTYWEAKDYQYKNHHLKFNDAAHELKKILNEAVSQCMVSDVPIGCFLSGGIDSSTIAALMQKNSSKQINTFSIGFNDKKLNEAEYAKEVANHIGTYHHELYVDKKDLIEFIPNLSEIYDEPFADSSQIPTAILSKLTKKYVTVALSGDGADELFGGYTRYSQALLLSNLKRFTPKIGVLAGIKLLNNFNLHNKIYKGLNVIKNPYNEIYNNLIDCWKKEQLSRLLFDQAISQNIINESGKLTLEKMTLADTLQYLPDDIMVKVDRASMHFSLETRAPFLNSKVIEYAIGLPNSFKLKGNDKKIILKNIAKKYLPKKIMERPKQGFGVPLADWINNDINDWANSLLSKSSFDKHGILSFDEVGKIWVNNRLATNNNMYQIWAVLMFQSWYLNFMGN